MVYRILYAPAERRANLKEREAYDILSGLTQRSGIDAEGLSRFSLSSDTRALYISIIWGFKKEYPEKHFDGTEFEDYASRQLGELRLDMNRALSQEGGE